MKVSKTIVAICLSLTLLAPQAMAAKKVVAPTGAERKKQFDRALKECRKSKGGGFEVNVEWSTYSGRTGWWCVYRG